VWVAVLLFAIHAPVSELVQHFLLPGRSGDVWDAVLDLVGVALGAAALVVGARLRRW
jgi:VanZ family protein